MLGESSSLKLVGVSVGPAASNAWANGSGVGVKKKVRHNTAGRCKQEEAMTLTGDRLSIGTRSAASPDARATSASGLNAAGANGWCRRGWQRKACCSR